MPLARFLSLAAVTIALAGGFTVHQFAAAPTVQAQAAGPVYELRTYTAAPGKFDALNTRFRDHTLRIFAKHGVKNVVYWTPTEGPLMGNTLIYVIPHASREAAKKFWSALPGRSGMGQSQGRVRSERPAHDQSRSGVHDDDGLFGKVSDRARGSGLKAQDRVLALSPKP